MIIIHTPTQVWLVSEMSELLLAASLEGEIAIQNFNVGTRVL